MSLNTKISDLVKNAHNHKLGMRRDSQTKIKEDIQESAPRPIKDFHNSK